MVIWVFLNTGSFFQCFFSSSYCFFLPLSFVSDWLLSYAEDTAIVLPRRAEVFSCRVCLLAVFLPERAWGRVRFCVERTGIFVLLSLMWSQRSHFVLHLLFPICHPVFFQVSQCSAVPSCSFVISIFLPVICSSSFVFCIYAQIFSSVHPPTTTSLSAGSQPIEIYCVCVSLKCMQSGLTLSAVCMCEAPVSVYLSGFCGHIATSTEGRRDGERRKERMQFKRVKGIEEKRETPSREICGKQGLAHRSWNELKWAES